MQWTNQVLFGDSFYMVAHFLNLFLRKWLQVWLVQRSRVAHPTVSHTVPMGPGSLAHLHQTRLQGWHVCFPGEFHDSQPEINSFRLISSLLASWSLQNLAVFRASGAIVKGGSEIRLKFMVRCLLPLAQCSTYLRIRDGHWLELFDKPVNIDAHDTALPSFLPWSLQPPESKWNGGTGFTDSLWFQWIFEAKPNEIFIKTSKHKNI